LEFTCRGLHFGDLQLVLVSALNLCPFIELSSNLIFVLIKCIHYLCGVTALSIWVL
jgi:hypothetical protein